MKREEIEQAIKNGESVWGKKLTDRIEKFDYLEKTKKRVGNNKYKKYKELFSPYGFYRLRTIYQAMKQRCYNSNNSYYSIYGGKGIRICNEWLNDRTKFYDWSYENKYAVDLTIDRIDSNKGYSPENCRWVTNKVQNNNRAVVKKFNINNELLTIPEICRKFNIPKTTFSNRYYRDKDSIEDIIKQGNKMKTKKNAFRFLYNGKYMTIKELAQINNISPITVLHRLRRGNSIEVAILTKKDYIKNRQPKPTFTKPMTSA